MGTLSFVKTKFIFSSDGPNDDRLAKKAGLQFVGSRWVTRKIDKAAKLREFADGSCDSKFKKRFFTPYLVPEHSLRWPSSLTPKPFQLESAIHALTRSPAYVADEAGLGKTITSVLCMNAVRGKVLIVCPPFLKYNWENEIKTWQMDKALTIGIVGSGRESDEKFMADIIICPDSLISNKRIQNQLSKHKFMWLFVDEAHRFKDEERSRTQAFIDKIAPLSERLVMLSGTPMPNGRPIELWPLIGNLAQEAVKHRSREEFINQFCDPKEVELREWIGGQMRNVTRVDSRGASNLKTLKQELYEMLMIRHLKSKVLPELPSKVRQIIYLDKPKKINVYEKKILTHYSIEDLIGEDKHLGDIATFRMESGIAMVPFAVRFISEQITQSRTPIIIFAIHVEVVKRLAEALEKFKPIVIRGGMDARRKHELANEFQTCKKFRPLIANIDSVGVGLTLTRAKQAIFVEPSWVSGTNEQAEDRLHRMTQTGQTLYQYLLMPKSINEKILRANFKKANDIALVMS